jgi:hypothetical protein
MADGRINSCKECRKGYQRSRPHDKECERNQAEKPKAYHAANLKRWRSEDPQKLAVQLARRGARKLDAMGDLTVEEFEELCERYGKCVYAAAISRLCFPRITSFPCLWVVPSW